MKRVGTILAVVSVLAITAGTTAGRISDSYENGNGAFWKRHAFKTLIGN